MDLYDITYQYSFNLVISQLIYTSFVSQKKDFDIYYQFMKEIEQKEGITKNEYRLINIFILSIYRNNTQETFYLLEKFIKLNYIKPKMVYRKSLSFIHYLKEKTICIRRSLQFSYYVETNYEKLSANNWELHKQLIKEGVNPNEISKIIRNDEIDKLQEISTQENFDFNQIIEPSLYERCSFINQNNVTLIDYAAFFSSVKCFKYLLMNGAKLENTGKYAVAGGNLEIIHLCEQNHSSLNDTIDIAIRYHKNDVFYYLYENKFYDTKDLSSIQKKCIIYYNYELILFLFKKGMNFPLSTLNEIAKIGNIYILQPYIDENQISNEILIYSSLSGNIELVKYIIEKNIIDINFETIAGNTALIFASENGHTEIVKLLLEQNEININARNNQGNSALIYATQYGHTEIVKLLLKQQINISPKDQCIVLMYASQNGYSKIMKLLLKLKNIDVNCKYNGKTALVFASENGHIKTVKIILEKKGIDINTGDNDGWTALMIASNNGYTEIVKMLLEKEGIDINAKTYGYTALICASNNGYTEIVKLLLEQKDIDINAEVNYQGSALIFATKNGYIEIVKFLLEQKGININAKDGWNGKTALMIASENGHTEIVKLLLKQEGIDINAEDKNGQTALMLASENGYTKIVRLFSK